MNNLIIKTLFKKEVSHIKWVALLMIVALLLPILASINTSASSIELQQQDPSSYDYRYVMNSENLLEVSFFDFFAWFVIPILISMQFLYMRKDSVGNMIASLPFTRRDRIRTKYFLGILVIILTYLVSFIVLSTSYYSSIHPIAGDYIYIPIWTIIAAASAILQYSFIFLIATIVGNSIFAGIFGYILIYTPMFIIGSYIVHIDRFFNTNLLDLIADNWFPQVFAPHIYSLHNLVRTNDSMLSPTNYVSYFNIISLFMLYSALSFVFYQLAQWAFSKNELEHNGNLCMFKWTEILFSIGFTLCFGSLALSVSSAFSDGWLEPIMTIAAFICYPIGFFFSKKIMQMTGYQSAFIDKSVSQNLMIKKS